MNSRALPERWPDRGTELGMGLQAALANLDPGYGGRIVVCTDGVTTGTAALSIRAAVIVT